MPCIFWQQYITVRAKSLRRSVDIQGTMAFQPIIDFIKAAVIVFRSLAACLYHSFGKADAKARHVVGVQQFAYCA